MVGVTSVWMTTLCALSYFSPKTSLEGDVFTASSYRNTDEEREAERSCGLMTLLRGCGHAGTGPVLRPQIKRPRYFRERRQGWSQGVRPTPSHRAPLRDSVCGCRSALLKFPPSFEGRVSIFISH